MINHKSQNAEIDDVLELIEEIDKSDHKEMDLLKPKYIPPYTNGKRLGPEKWEKGDLQHKIL